MNCPALLRLVFALGVIGFVVPTASSQSWLSVEESGAIRLSPGDTVQIEGVGHLRFGEDRSQVSVDGQAPMRVRVDGQPIQGRRAILIGSESVEIRTADGGRWTLRRVPNDRIDSAEEGTHIRDDNPEGESRVDSTDSIRFFVRIDADGASHFFHPL